MWLKHFHHRISWSWIEPSSKHWKGSNFPSTGSCASAHIASLRNQWKLLRFLLWTIKVWHNFQLIFSSRRDVGVRRRVLNFVHSKIRSSRDVGKSQKHWRRKYENLWENRAYNIFDFSRRIRVDRRREIKSCEFLQGAMRRKSGWIIVGERKKKIVNCLLKYIFYTHSSRPHSPSSHHHRRPHPVHNSHSSSASETGKRMLRFSVSCWVLINKRTIITAEKLLYFRNFFSQLNSLVRDQWKWKWKRKIKEKLIL